MAAIQSALGNYFGGFIRASRGIFITNTNLNSQTNWISWTPAFDPATQTIPPVSATAFYRQIADQVYINLVISFIYSPPGPDTNVVTITGFPVLASSGAKYSNLCSVDAATAFTDVCYFRIDPSVNNAALNIVQISPFVSATAYTIRGQLTYKTFS